MIKEAIRKLMVSKTAITDKVPAAKMHYDKRPQGETGNCLVIQRPILLHDGDTFGAGSNHASGVARLNAFGESQLSADDILEVIRKALDGYAGDVAGVGESESETLTIGYLKFSDVTEIPVINLEGDQTPPYYGAYVDVEFAYNETPPTF